MHGSIQNQKEAKLHNTQSVFLFFLSKFYLSYFIEKVTIYRVIALINSTVPN